MIANHVRTLIGKLSLDICTVHPSRSAYSEISKIPRGRESIGSEIETLL